MENQIIYENNTLFGEKVISSISFNEQEMIRDILYLHSDGHYIDCDPCFSVGNFYKDGLPIPKNIFDKFPQIKNTIEASSNNLPLENESVFTVMFDPPFVIGGEDHEGIAEGSNLISRRFTNFHSWSELKDMYSSSLKEFYRILKPNGIVIFKCQDVVASGKQHITHSWLNAQAISVGFYPKDLFILLAKARMTDGRKQQHARKFHSYYLVFKKAKCPIDYKTQ